MMDDRSKDSYLQRKLRFLPLPLQQALIGSGDLSRFPKGALLLKEGQYVSAVPLVLEGRLKVYAETADKRLLLYYIQPEESCVMSFSAVLEDRPSSIIAEVEEEAVVLLLPSHQLQGWLRRFPMLNQLFFRQYQRRYTELLHNIEQLLFHRLDDRLLAYLKERQHITGQSPLVLTHRKIAEDLGSAREVISRTLKKLEAEGAVVMTDSGIKIC
jgi:CRP/FNR family transcriptional regulator